MRVVGTLGTGITVLEGSVYVCTDLDAGTYHLDQQQHQSSLYFCRDRTGEILIHVFRIAHGRCVLPAFSSAGHGRATCTPIGHASSGTHLLSTFLPSTTPVVSAAMNAASCRTTRFPQHPFHNPSFSFAPPCASATSLRESWYCCCSKQPHPHLHIGEPS